MELEELKNILRIDHDEDDTYLLMLQKVAQRYVTDAIDQNATLEVLEKREQFNFAVLLLVGHWYQNRLATSETALNDSPYGVLPLIQQLRGWYYANY
ncbi:head-tail connector protein [Bacillus sp. FSL M8-0168]|uniref:head-tail connector protein n=1 Tax=Bacillus sp. FSL M8-0168 TaxID=2921614 RepID=UPI0030FD466B